MNYLKQHLDNKSLILIFRGVVVGLLSGLIVGSFRWLIEISLRFWQKGFRLAHTNWTILLGGLILVLIISLILAKFLHDEPHIAGSGIPEVEIQLQGQLTLNWWSILWRKYVGGVLAIGSGLFLGREGPSIQLGSSIGQGIAEQTNLNKTNTRILIASGAAGGLAAAFNAPIAGTMFVLEEVFHNFSVRVWLSSLSAALAANFVTSTIFGLQPVLAISHQTYFPLSSYWTLLVLGIFLGLFGLLYQKVLLLMPHLYAKIKFIPTSLNGLVPLLLLLPLGYFAPELLGGGNNLILDLNTAKETTLLLFGVFLLRFVFSMISYGSGLPGGIFLPILTLGAVLGALFGNILVVLHLISPTMIPSLIIFAMAGYFAGIGKAPFTAILLITEMVGNLANLMPLAIVSLVAYIVVDLFKGAPIYESLADKMMLPNSAQFSGKTDQLTLTIVPESHLVGQPVKTIHWPKNTLLIKITRGTKALIPDGSTILRAGDFVTFVVPYQQRLTVRKKIERM